MISRLYLILSVTLVSHLAIAQTNSTPSTNSVASATQQLQQSINVGDTYEDIKSKFGTPNIEFPLPGGQTAVWYKHSEFVFEDGKVVSLELLDPVEVEKTIAKRKAAAAKFEVEYAQRIIVLKAHARKEAQQAAAFRKAQADRIARKKKEREDAWLAYERQILWEEELRQQERNEKRANRAANAAYWATVNQQQLARQQQQRASEYPYVSASGTRYKYDLSNPLDRVRYQADPFSQLSDKYNYSVKSDRSVYGEYGGGAEK